MLRHCANFPGLPGPNGAGGVSYVRWGKTTCNETAGAEVVYTGRAAGAPFDNAGGGAGYICLPDSPEFLDVSDGFDSGRGRVNGAEYHTPSPAPAFADLNNHNVPCVVCFVEERADMIMIPARDTCPPSWTMEYYGYLMSGDDGDRRVGYECMDINAEAIPGSGSDDNGALFAFNEVSCGSSNCFTYVQGHELSCAVCTY